MMTTLAHLSDVHLAPLPPVRFGQLLNKRITGYLNWRLTRQKSLDGEGLTRLVRHLRAQEPDITAVTGDLVNLALDAEYNTAHNWLETVGEPEQVCVCPGNHDAYIKGQLDKALHHWGDYVRGETLDDEMFPFVRRVGNVALISCTSAVPTLPFMSSGKFDDAQAERLARILTLLGEGGYFRVVVIHHPPDKESFHPRLGLYGGQAFRRVIAASGAEMVLHGHTHKSTIHSMEGPSGDIPVVGVAAAGTAQSEPGSHDPARYNLFNIQRSGSAWKCSMREYGYQRLGGDIVLRLNVRLY